MRVLLTGALGRVGTAVLDHLRSKYTFTNLDKDSDPEYETVTGDVLDYDAIRPAFEDQDAVVHLAGDPRVSAAWGSVLENNIIGTYNVFRAAADAGVERIVFASSNHVVGMYEEEYAPELYTGELDVWIDHTDPVRPDSFYATSKIFGEALGRYYVERDGPIARCHALRICSVREPTYDHPYGDAEKGVDEGKWERGSPRYERAVQRMKSMWHSRRDMAHLVDRSLRADADGFDIFYGVSDNATRWVDISHAQDVIDYDPVDSADGWAAPPE